jgi:transposase
VTVRLDDPAAGSETQVDCFSMGRWHDPAAGQERRMYGFLMTLAHSRHQFLYPVRAETGACWLEGHIAAFRFFGGVPRRLVPDNLSAGIRRADRDDPRLNRAYAELARSYGGMVDPARVRHPKDKPKVERQVSYARESFFGGREFASLDAMRGRPCIGRRRWPAHPRHDRCAATGGVSHAGTAGPAAFASQTRGGRRVDAGQGTG